MKKIICLVLTVCLLGASFALVACTPRSEKLIIRNWGDYMSEEVYKGFESWYKEKTGKNVKVVYGEFDSNETVYAQVAQAKRDYDLICPSDYMIERMKEEKLLLELSEETKGVILDAVDPAVIEFSKTFDTDLKYTMPYLWGTLGIMYNSLTAGYNEEVMGTWSVLFDEQYKDKVFMKDSPRDAYTVAMLHSEKENLLREIVNGADSQEYKNILNPIFTSPSQATIDTAKEILKEQKRDGLVKEYDLDQCKDMMLNDPNGTDGYFGMFYSCDAGYVMNGDEDESSNRNLRYIVPNEGGNVWVDGFVIPKYAKNIDAANYFIQYLCETDIAYECMDFVGTTTAIEEAAKEYKSDLEDSDFFDGAPAGFEEMYMEMMFPSSETLERCAMMKDFDTHNEGLLQMWQEVKNTSVRR